MQLIMLKSKIHRATLTSVNLEYEGSISIDPIVLKHAGIYLYEQVHVVNANNGSRLITYAIEGREGSGEIALNGAAARCGLPGDIVIIIAYCNVEEKEFENHKPRLVYVDSGNRIVKSLK